MAKIALIVGSVRRDRQGIKVARWIEEKLKNRNHVVFFIDPLELNLPLLDRMYKETENPSEKLRDLRNKIKEAEGYFLSLHTSAVGDDGIIIENNGTTFSESITFMFNATGGFYPPLDFFECNIDGKEWKRCDSPITFNSLERKKIIPLKFVCLVMLLI